jgi:hypothetical protein
MSELLRPTGESLIEIFLVDRFACGYSYELMSSEYRKFFDVDLTEFEFESYKNKYAEAIDKRKADLREYIYKSGTYSKLLDIADVLYTSAKSNESNPKELASLAATLRGYLDTLNQLGIKKDVQQIKQQNNFIILKSLERDGLIKITDEKQVKYLVDGVVDAELD